MQCAGNNIVGIGGIGYGATHANSSNLSLRLVNNMVKQTSDGESWKDLRSNYFTNKENGGT